jgi:hypothetical protein
MVPPAFLVFFDWFSMPVWNEAEFPDRFDWLPLGTCLEERGTTDFYFKQFEYIRRIGIDNVAWEFSKLGPHRPEPYSYPPASAVEALQRSGMKIAPHYDLELSFQVYDQAGGRPEIVSTGRIKPDLETVELWSRDLRVFYERIAPEVIARDRNGDIVIFVFGYGFSDDNPDPSRWSRFAEALIARTTHLLGSKFKFYLTCTNHRFQEHLFLHHRRHFTPYNFVLDTPQSQFGHDSVTWNFGFDNLYVLQHYKTMRVVRLDPRYVEEPAWLAAAADPALIFIYSWNEPFEGSFLFPSVQWGETKARLAAHYLAALKDAPPERLPRVLLVVDDLAQAFGPRQDDWHLELLREMLLYRLRLFAPQADVVIPPEIDDALLDRYDGIIDLTSEKEPRVVAMIRARRDRQRTMLFEPLAQHDGAGYSDAFFRTTRYAPINASVAIDGSAQTVFVRDDVLDGEPHPHCTVHLWALAADGHRLPLVITDGASVLVNSYGNSDEVMRVAFEQFYGRPMGTSILYGEGHASQRLEQTADGAITYNRLLRHSVNERWPIPPWANWRRLPPRTDPVHAEFIFGAE